jgi:predicted Fe-Mo cluster-binding NifX family protein
MRIAIATDEGYVSAGFGCAPFCTIVDCDASGRIRETLLIPNPGHGHAFWADLCFRNSIGFVIAGSMGPCATSTLRGRGIEPIVGVTGRIEDVVRRFAAGEFAADRAEVVQVQ